MSQITTHVLDTSIGKPGIGITILLEKKEDNGNWNILGEGVTNTDGRAPLLLPDATPGPGIYRLVFFTGAYYKKLGVKGFYPSVTIEFEISDRSHYHVPLLLNPYGYSTYRGS